MWFPSIDYFKKPFQNHISLVQFSKYRVSFKKTYTLTIFYQLLHAKMLPSSAGSIPKLFDSDFIIGTIFDFDYGRFWQIIVDRFFYDFDSEKLSRNRRFFDSSILIKINPAKKLVFLSFLSQKIEIYL